MDYSDIRDRVAEYKTEINNGKKLNLSLEECNNLYNNDFDIVVKDGFIIDIKNKD